ncbi:cytochrome c-type biogenesis protein CcmH [soil metagenome]
MIRPRLRTAAIVLLVVCGAAGAIDTEPAFDEPALQQRYERLITQIRCLVCQNNSIADSNAALAADLRRQIRDMIAADRGDGEIIAFLTERYGDYVLYRPPWTPRTWLLWLAPLLLGAAGIWVAARIVLTRSRLPIDDEADTSPQ